MKVAECRVGSESVREKERDRLVFQMIMASVSSASFMSSSAARRPVRRPLFGCLVALLPLPSLPCSSSRQWEIQFHISFALCTVVCLSLAAAASEQARGHITIEKPRRKDTVRPRPKEGGPRAPCSALPPSWIKDGGEREENSAGMQAHMA